MRVFSLLAVSAALIFAAPVQAQTAPSPERLALAQRYLELSQGSAVTDAIKEELEQTYARSELSTAEREWLTSNMTITMSRVLEQAMLDMRDDVALLFTEEELRATVAFYETPLGQSIADKSIELGMEMQRTMMPYLMEGITKLGEKYCARFACATDGATDGAAALGKSTP